MSHDRRYTITPYYLKPILGDEPPQDYVGWFGDRPSFPSTQRWPLCKDGDPMVFACQIALKALPAEVWDGLAPRVGWLSFFVHISGEGCVVHTSELGSLMYPPETYQGLGYLRFSRPEPGSSEMYKKYWLKCGLDREDPQLSYEPHKLCGEPDRFQEVSMHYGELPPEDRERYGLSKSDLPLPYSLGRNRLLLQLGSDRRLDCNWAGGTFQFIIADDDLSIGRYDRVHLHHDGD